MTPAQGRGRAAGAALAGLAGGLAALAGGPAALAAQADARGSLDAPPTVRFRLEEPTPNPFRDRVVIPFVLGEGPEPRWRSSVGGDTPRETGEEAAGRRPDRATVSIRIYNLLHQNVAWARAWPSAGREGRTLRDVRYPVPGRYSAVWDGRSRAGYRVAPGPYFVEIVVEGWTAVRKVLLTR